MKLPTKLFHYSGRELNELQHDFYDKFKEHWPEEGSMKPYGLWISVEESEDDYSWFDWCKGEQFRLEGLQYKYSVKLAKDIKILHLQTAQDIQNFSIQYAANDPFDFGRSSIFNRTTEYVYSISWKRVKAEYDGIIISPYQWSCRLSSGTSWYYPWDCASGCIWNLDKVKLKFHSEIDIESIKHKEESEELVAAETQTDSLLASLVPLT